MQVVHQLENAFAINATLAKHHVTVDARVAPAQTQDGVVRCCFSGSESWCKYSTTTSAMQFAEMSALVKR